MNDPNYREDGDYFPEETTAVSGHTPGPWVVEVCRGPHDRDCGLSIMQRLPAYRGEVAHVADAENIGGITVAERNANARLIAAAPDLLEACQTVLAGFDRGIAVDANTVNGLVAARLRSAVAKAEGRS
ncbi:MAG TPA: hypothetical protein VLH36_13890 [Steroidobacteraceae bacterium]|nr:hypothetical protein [Steroidobacteraceae bacterium]